jgi:hypothetical protein
MNKSLILLLALLINNCNSPSNAPIQSGQYLDTLLIHIENGYNKKYINHSRVDSSGLSQNDSVQLSILNLVPNSIYLLEGNKADIREHINSIDTLLRFDVRDSLNYKYFHAAFGNIGQITQVYLKKDNKLINYLFVSYYYHTDSSGLKTTRSSYTTNDSNFYTPDSLALTARYDSLRIIKYNLAWY